MNIETLQETIDSNEAVMVYFSGENCGVCEVLQPKIKKLLDDKFPKIKQVYISANKFQSTAAAWSVFTVPTLVVFLDSKEYIKKSRNISLLEFEKELQRPYSLYFS